MTPEQFAEYQRAKRAERVWLAGDWAADDAAWERLTGQRWPQPPGTVVEGQAEGEPSS